MPINKVFKMDCMDYMKTLPDKVFDLAIVDPEYGLGADNPSMKNAFVKQKNGSYLKVKQSIYAKKNWDSKPAGKEYFNELIRVSKNQIIFGVNYYDYPFGPGRIVWDKINGNSDQMGCEIAYCSLNNRTDMVYYMWSGMFQGVYCGKNLRKASLQQGNKKLNEKRIHPTQKPVALYAWLMNEYAEQGYTIFDSHVGSGSARIASYYLGFDFYGTEIDDDIHASQEKRFRQECFGEIITEKGILVQKKLFTE